LAEELSVLLTIWLAIVVSFSLYFLSTYIRPPEGGTRDPRALVVGILGLAFGAMHLRGVYSVVFENLPHPAVLFRVVRALVTGGWAAILVSMGYRRGARIMLIVAGILFVGSPLALALYLHWTDPEVALHSILAAPRFYVLEAWPVGIAIPALFLLWRSGSNDGKGAGHDSSPIDVEHTAEIEMET
jgi:hypothetical protein